MPVRLTLGVQSNPASEQERQILAEERVMKGADKSFAGASVLILPIIVCCLASLAAAQNWVQLNPTGGPPVARVVHTAVYDAATNRMVVFGGRLGAVAPYLGDVWVLANAAGGGGSPAWIQLVPTGGPPSARGFHTAVYHPATNRMVIFGGGETPLLRDTWVLTNANGLGGPPGWIQLAPTGGPPRASHKHTAVYDAGTNRMVVFGGWNGSTGVSDTWVLTNANGLGGAPEWTQLAPVGGPPPERWAHTAVYDPATNRMVVFGGWTGSAHLNDVWVLRNANGLGGPPSWTQLAPAGGPPPVRSFHTAVYDSVTNRMVVFGGWDGSGVGNDVWVLTNANGLGGSPGWVRLSPAGRSPTIRWAHSAIYDPPTNGMVVFDGMTASGPVSDVWLLADARWDLASVSAASYASGAPLAPESIVTAFGRLLSANTEAATSLPLPFLLAGSSVTVTDSTGAERLASLFFVSPSQINYVVPPGTAVGPATVTVTSWAGVAARGPVEIAAVAPALFTVNQSGQGVAAALAVTVKPDGSQSWQYVFPQGCVPGTCVATPIDLGSETDLVFLQLYGTGFRGRSSLAAVSAKIGREDAPVVYAGPAPGFVGLDQANVRVPRSLLGRGEVDIVLTVDGRPANTVKVNIR